MFKKIVPQSEFAKNVITLVTGTAIAQAIPLAISPILTRLYSPDDFGVFALYLSISSVLSVIATGRYEFAITLPAKDEDAVQILWLSCAISFIVSLITFIIILLFNSDIATALGNERIAIWLYAIPVTVFLSGICQSFNYWFNRKRKYSKLSKNRVIQTMSSSSVNLSVGYVSKGGTFGLIVGNVIGQIASAIFFIHSFFNKNSENKFNFKKPKVIALAKRYRNFPKYDVMASFFNISSNQITHIFYNSFFSSVIAGYFYLTQKIIQVPVTLIAGAIQDVFKMEIVTVHLKNGDTRNLFLKTAKKLFLLALLPTIVIYFFAVDLFALVFGEEWRVAGEYAKIFTPVFFLRFISFPLSYMLYVKEKQLYNIIGQFLLLTAVVITFILGKDSESINTVVALSWIYSIFYILYFIMSFNLTNHGNKKQ
jgi:O-antigen/teichoic acid export membrane protein